MGERARRLLSWLLVYRGVGIPATREGVKFSYVAMIPIAALTILWYVDVQYRGRVVAGQVEAHRTDFTVFTEAGAALFDGRDPYRVTNPRGWFYLYPPLFALLVSPLAFLDSQSQVFVWYLVSIALGFGCYHEACRIWHAVAGPRATTGTRRLAESNFAIGVGVCAALAVACPALDCLQRGQLGIVLVYSLLLGFRLTTSPGSGSRAWLGGLVLAWPVVVKLIPALPVSCMLLQRWAVAFGRGSTRQEVTRAASFTSGLALGGFLFVLAIPGAAIGWSRNLDYLHEWARKVATNENLGQDAKFSIDSVNNQSLRNAAHLFSDTWAGVGRDATTDLHRLAIDASIARRHLADRFTRLMSDIARVIVLVLLAAVTLKLGRERERLTEAVTFGLASLAVLLVSPLAWGHYFVFALPAALFVPLWLRTPGPSPRGQLGGRRASLADLFALYAETLVRTDRPPRPGDDALVRRRECHGSPFHPDFLGPSLDEVLRVEASLRPPRTKSTDHASLTAPSWTMTKGRPVVRTGPGSPPIGFKRRSLRHRLSSGECDRGPRKAGARLPASWRARWRIPPPTRREDGNPWPVEAPASPNERRCDGGSHRKPGEFGGPPRVEAGSHDRRKRFTLLATINLLALATAALVGEVGLRLAWHPNYQIRCERWFFGSGMTTAGRKYLPDSTYRIDSPEFQIRFQTNAKGYRARPEETRTANPYRIAFVGDSFTEGMQVEYDKTFCALIERSLAGAWQGREVVCENYGIAATGLFEYWHRITHDVLRPDAPDALVLCTRRRFVGESDRL